MSQWQPIETAPQDGTEILLGHWFAEGNGYWGDPRWLWQASGRIDEEGVWVDFVDDHINPVNFRSVTHWMPLPKPPGGQP